MPPAIPLIVGAAVAGISAAGVIGIGGAITVLGVTLSAAAFGAIVAAGACVGPVTITERRRP